MAKSRELKELKAQVALEMLLIIAFMLLFFIPLVAYVFIILSEETWQMEAQQANAAEETILAATEKLVILGAGSSTTVTIQIPSRVKEVYVPTNNNRTLVMSLDIPKIGLIEQVGMADKPIMLSGDWENVTGMSRVFINYTGTEIVLRR